MATGTPVYPTGYDTLDTLGAVSGIIPGTGGTHLGDSGPGQGTLLGITKNVLNTILSIENVTGFPGTVLSSTHAFRVSALETSIATKVSTTDVRLSPATVGSPGLVPALDNNSAHFLDGTGAWTTPAGGGGGGNPFLTTSASFTVPAINVTVNVTVAATTDMHTAETHVITDGLVFMIGRVTTIAGLVVTYTNQGGGGSVSGPMGAGHVYMSGAMAAIDNTTTHFLSGDGTFTSLPANSTSSSGTVAASPNNVRKYYKGDSTWDYTPNTTETTASFNIPAIGATVPIQIVATTFPFVGLTLIISGSGGKGWFEVTAVADTTHITVKNMGYVGTDVATTTIVNPAVVRGYSPGVAISTGAGFVPTPSGTATDFFGGDALFHSHSTVALDTLGATTDITTRNATSSAHGLLAKTSGTSTDFVGGDNVCHAHSTVALDTLGTTTDITTLNASTSSHGLLKKLDNTSTHFLDGTGAWSTPPAATATVTGYVPTPPNNTTTFLRGDATFAAPSIKPWKIWNANDAFPAATLYGVWSVVNAIPFLAFNDSATWTSVFLGIVPTGSNLGSGVIVRLKWASATATSGSVIWGAAIERCGNLTVASDHFDTQVKSTAATAGTVELFTETAITVTTINSMVAGDVFRLQVQRRGDDVSGNDTMAGDAQLFSVSIEGAA